MYVHTYSLADIAITLNVIKISSCAYSRHNAYVNEHIEINVTKERYGQDAKVEKDIKDKEKKKK